MISEMQAKTNNLTVFQSIISIKCKKNTFRFFALKKTQKNFTKFRQILQGCFSQKYAQNFIKKITDNAHRAKNTAPSKKSSAAETIVEST